LLGEGHHSIGVERINFRELIFDKRWIIMNRHGKRYWARVEKNERMSRMKMTEQARKKRGGRGRSERVGPKRRLKRRP
jgi:hypothetical protein